MQSLYIQRIRDGYEGWIDTEGNGRTWYSFESLRAAYRFASRWEFQIVDITNA